MEQYHMQLDREELANKALDQLLTWPSDQDNS